MVKPGEEHQIIEYAARVSNACASELDRHIAAATGAIAQDHNRKIRITATIEIGEDRNTGEITAELRVQVMETDRQARCLPVLSLGQPALFEMTESLN